MNWWTVVYFVKRKLHVNNRVLRLVFFFFFLTCISFSRLKLVVTGASGKSGSPVADHVELVNSIGLEHVIILYPVVGGRSAKEVRLRCNPAMYITVKVCI